MMELLTGLLLIAVVLLAVVTVMYYLRGVRVKDLKGELASARRDTKHWYDECTKLEVKAHVTTTDPMFVTTGHIPKDYEE